MAEKKILDVAKPKDAKVEIGSKPMIVGHKSLAGDPMVRQQESGSAAAINAAPEQAEKVTLPSATKKIIAPISDEEKADNAPKQDAVEAADDMPVEAKTGTGVHAGSLREGSGVRALRDDATPASEKKEAKIDPVAEAMEREAAVRKLIDSKKYRVNIKQARNSRKGIVWSLVILLVAGFGSLFYLADTDRIDLGFELPFSIFNEENDESTLLQNDQAEAQTTPAQQEAASQAVEEAASKPMASTSTNYQVTFPDDWAFAHSISEEDTFTSPNGVTVKFTQDPGGRGGDCEPGTNDVPYATGNSCSTYELLSKDELKIDGLAADTKLFIVHQKHADATTGKLTYALCLRDENVDAELQINQPVMGAWFPGCGAGITMPEGYITFSIEGVDASSEAYFDNPDIKIIETALKTFKLL